jgi:hypothetical protein
VAGCALLLLLQLIAPPIEKMHPKLLFLHAGNLLNAVKLAQFRRMSTQDLMSSLMPGQPGCLKARPDGTLLDGHHRLSILIERGEDIDGLPREILERKDHES